MMRNLCHTRGFTLIELLVVMLLVGVTLGMVTVQLMPDNRSVLRDEAQRLALLLENAGYEARTSGKSLAWSPDKDGYCFWRKNDYGDWVRMTDDALFKARALPSGMVIQQMTVEDLPLKKDEKVTFSAVTFPLPFRVQLSYVQNNAFIMGSSTGTVSVELENSENTR